MNIYISGISGSGMRPLAMMAREAGFLVFGSDLKTPKNANDLDAKLEYGKQDGEFLRKCAKEEGVDWFVHTSALPIDHPELQTAKDLGLKITKRDELIAFLVEKLDLKMLAVAGTHGKTTTASMLVWTFKELGVPVAWLVGADLPFAPAGHYEPGAKLLIYEADEYDRNFLHYEPWLSIITAISYDHPDIYKTKEEYFEAFWQFANQSERIVAHEDVQKILDWGGRAGKTLKGLNGAILSPPEAEIGPPETILRYDGTLALAAILEAFRGFLGDSVENSEVFLGGTGDLVEGFERVSEDFAEKFTKEKPGLQVLVEILNRFPGAHRRFEKLVSGVYSDYAHHPEEIQATLKLAEAIRQKNGQKGVVTVYQPHQNARQLEVFSLYKGSFDLAERVFWLPTFLTREPTGQRVILPEEFVELVGKKASVALLDEELAKTLKALRAENYLILLMTAGPADEWFRKVWE